MSYKNFKNTEIIEEIGNELRKIRNSKGLTISQVANDLSNNNINLSNTLLGRIETGERRIDDDLLNLICDYYDVDPISIIISASQEHINRLSNFSSVKTYSIGVPEISEINFEDLNKDGWEHIKRLVKTMSLMDEYKK